MQLMDRLKKCMYKCKIIIICQNNTEVWDCSEWWCLVNCKMINEINII